ncbi:MAG: thiol:disulfide interchange protein DsbA/DsbL [Rhodocyclaceae bacterium]|jgi:thiol:disulfide interchange protein DsbA|nr:thiol:disulfide interchange protein DsbA/DsbL [Rhodocyclaceae bacterium]
MKSAKLLAAAAAAGLLALSPLSSAWAAAPLEGKHYSRLQMPQPTEQAGKVEVIEFFWYGCPHCFDFEPLLQQWKKKLPADVHFRKVPAIFRDTWAPGARIYYTLEAMNLLDRLNESVFNAMIKQRINLNDENTLFDWMAKQGVDRQKFADTYKSFSVDAKVRKAAEMTQEYGFGGVPVVIVGGKYMPAPNLGTFGTMLQVVDGLIAKERAELKK